MTRKTLSKLRLPARVVDGVIEFEYGGKLPVRDDARAEVVINTTDVMDPGFLDRMTRRRTVKLLPEGTVLLAMLSDPRRVGSLDVVISEDPPKTIRPKFGGWFDRRRGPQTPLLVPLRLGPLLPLQASPDDDGKGGLWMALEGARTISLISSSVLLPKAVSKDAVRSMNHAYTRLSEHFETQRISHTGNVYEQVLYQEPNGLWYPLKVFRDEKIADEENQIARVFWDDLKASLSQPAKKG